MWIHTHTHTHTKLFVWWKQDVQFWYNYECNVIYDIKLYINLKFIRTQKKTKNKSKYLKASTDK